MSSNFNQFLKKGFHIEIDAPDLIGLNRTIINNLDEKSPKEISKSLFEWVRDNIRYRIVEIIGPTATIKRGTGACVDKSSLLITLLRMNKIPAKYLIIRAIFSKKLPIKISYVDHCAVEAYINNRWIILDPTFDPFFDNIFPKSEFGNPNWWDLKKSIIHGRVAFFTPLEIRLISDCYKNPTEWKLFINKILKNSKISI